MEQFNIEKIMANLGKTPKSRKDNFHYINQVLHLVENYLIDSESEKVLFSEFGDLSFVMNLLDMNAEKQLEYILAFVEENVKTNVVTQDDLKVLHIDVADYKKISYVAEENNMSITPEIMAKIYERHMENQPLCIWEKKVLKVLLDSLERTDQFRKLMQNINENYLQKQDTYTMDDVNVVMKAFDSIGVHCESCTKIRRLLVQKYKNRVYDKKSESAIFVPLFSDSNEKDASKSEHLTSKQYKLLRKEIEDVIVLDSMQVKRELSFEERIVFASKLLLLGYSENDIKKFLCNSDALYQLVITSKKDGSVKEDLSVAAFIHLYQMNKDRYLYYNQKYLLGFDEMLETIDLYVELSMETNGLENLDDIKDEICNHILMIQSFIPKTYEYELERVEKEKTKQKEILKK